MCYKLELVGKKLAKEFGICNYQLRNRMIQVGYSEARGSLNFVGDGYIEPFATDPGACRGNQNFVISPKELLEEYDVSYIFVGSKEREKYGDALNEEVLNSLGEVVFQDEVYSTYILKVNK